MSDYNKITTTEVLLKYDKVISEVNALKSYLACFEREWDVPMDGYKYGCDYDAKCLASERDSFRQLVEATMPSSDRG